MTTNKVVSAEALQAMAYYIGNPSSWEAGTSGAVEAAMRGVQNSARDISAADVAAWLIGQSKTLPFKGAQVTAYVNNLVKQPDGSNGIGVTWMVYSSQLEGVGYEAADDYAEAVAKVKANLKNPKDKVEALRAQASELLRKADEMAATLNSEPVIALAEWEGSKASIRFHLEGFKVEANYVRNAYPTGFAWELDGILHDGDPSDARRDAEKDAARNLIRILPSANSESVSWGARREHADFLENEKATEARRHS